MKITCNWAEKMKFEVANATGQSIIIDSKPPLGRNAGPTPKELALMGVAGCTSMDVITHMRKHHQNVESFSVEAEAPTQTGDLPVFLNVMLIYKVTGKDVEASQLIEAVHLSQTKYCSVSAMMSKAAPVSYEIQLNGAVVGTGKAEF